MHSDKLEGKQFVKKNIPIRKFTEGDELIGRYLKRRVHPDYLDKESGEVKDLNYLIFEEFGEDLKPTGEKFQICENAGLKNALGMNDVNEGDIIKLVHLGKQKRNGKPGEVNTYDVFALQ